MALKPWSGLLEQQPQVRPAPQRTLQHWQKDLDFASVRDEKELAKLPEPERKTWLKLWADVNALRKQLREAR